MMKPNFFLSPILCLLAIVAMLLEAKVTCALEANLSGERVLFIHSYPIGERGHQLLNGFKDVVRQRFPDTSFKISVLDYNDLQPVFQNFHWDNFKKHKNLVHKHREILHQQIKDFNPTILVISDDEAAEVIHPLPEAFDKPVFFMGMNRSVAEIPWYQNNPSQYVGGIEDKKPIAASLRVLREMMPIKKIAIVTSDEMSSYLILKSILPQIERFSKMEERRMGSPGKIEVVKVIKSSKFNDWKEGLKAVEEDIDLVWTLIPYNVYNERGQEMKVGKIGRWMLENLKVPSIGISDINVKIGALFAQASNSRKLGEQLGEQVQGYLLSKKLRRIGFERRLGYDFFVNKDTANHFEIKIPEKRLPMLNVVYGTNVREKKGTK
ncbi:MAG: ABC transporter substrate binding protein [Bdellovibrionota bacterium]|nr:ABC transporter substrate binding protein [Bdellovibrionota bacterium]